MVLNFTQKPSIHLLDKLLNLSTFPWSELNSKEELFYLDTMLREAFLKH